jgi:hypothetical protein
MSKHVLVCLSDIHAGSSVAICPPEGIDHDDGGRYLPSRAQTWIWDHYISAIAEAKRIARGAPVTIAVNGDCVDGFHHPSSNAQYVSPLESVHVRIAHRVLTHAFDALKPAAIHATRGTGAHVGKAATLENGLFRVLRSDGHPIIDDPDTEQVTSYHRRYEIDGLLIDQRHHGRMGQRAHTRGPYLRWYAQDIEMEHRLDGERPPDIALRSHYHVYGDSGRDYRWRTRVVALPAMQLATEFVHRIASERLASIGIVVIVIRDGREDVIPLLARVARPAIITEAM